MGLCVLSENLAGEGLANAPNSKPKSTPPNRPTHPHVNTPVRQSNLPESDYTAPDAARQQKCFVTFGKTPSRRFTPCSRTFTFFPIIGTSYTPAYSQCPRNLIWTYLKQSASRWTDVSYTKPTSSTEARPPKRTSGRSKRLSRPISVDT